jgi:hypothetical protein
MSVGHWFDSEPLFRPSFGAAELLTDETFAWQTGRNYVALGPAQSHVLRIGG